MIISSEINEMCVCLNNISGLMPEGFSLIIEIENGGYNGMA